MKLIPVFLIVFCILDHSASTTVENPVVQLHSNDTSHQKILKWGKTNITYWIKNDSRIDMPYSEIKEAIEDAFNLWAGSSTLRFKQVPSGGDIRVEFAAISTPGRASQRWAQFQNTALWMYMDENHPIRRGRFDLLTVAAHELGHCLGLSDSTNSKSVMRGWYKHPFDTNGKYIRPKLSEEDIGQIQLRYGKNPDPTTTKAPRTTPLTPKSNVTTTDPPPVCGDWAVNCDEFKPHCSVVPADSPLVHMCAKTCGLCKNGLYK